MLPGSSSATCNGKNPIAPIALKKHQSADCYAALTLLRHLSRCSLVQILDHTAELDHLVLPRLRMLLWPSSQPRRTTSVIARNESNMMSIVNTTTSTTPGLTSSKLGRQSVGGLGSRMPLLSPLGPSQQGRGPVLVEMTAKLEHLACSSVPRLI